MSAYAKTRWHLISPTYVAEQRHHSIKQTTNLRPPSSLFSEVSQYLQLFTKQKTKAIKKHKMEDKLRNLKDNVQMCANCAICTYKEVSISSLRLSLMKVTDKKIVGFLCVPAGTGWSTSQTQFVVGQPLVPKWRIKFLISSTCGEIQRHNLLILGKILYQFIYFRCVD